MTGKERIFLFDTTLRSPSARSREAREPPLPVIPVRAVALLALAGVAMFGVHADAAWPPAPGADMRDRANWPNDFTGRWNYLSYFPERGPGAGPIDPFDQKLGAAR